MRSWLPHSHLYSSHRRFPVESHLLLGCSHKIPNRASVTSKLCYRDTAVHGMALGRSQRSTVASNTILGLCSQGPSRHVLPYAAPGFYAGCGHRGWWSSPNFASILLAPRDGILALCSGGRTQSKCMTILSSGVAMVFSLGLASQGSRIPIYSNGAQHRLPFTSLMAWRPYQDTVCTWSAGLLSAIGSTGTSAAGLMTPFQFSFFSIGGGISTLCRFCASTLHPWVARQQQAWLPGVRVWKFSLLCLFFKRRASVS
jgi:hypothetical protein